jgi:transitional endoplasmic reticulum ATPase
LNCDYELVQATDLMSKVVGESEERVRKLFQKYTKTGTRKKNALIFIDEIDALVPKREDCGETERRIVATFLTLLDGVNNEAVAEKRSAGEEGTDAQGSGGGNIVLLGATNRPNSLDPAIRRAGRLEREIEVGVPNAADRRAILEVHLRKMEALGNNATATARRSPGDEQKQKQNTASLYSLLVSEGKGGGSALRDVADACHGYVGADLAALCRQVAFLRIQQQQAQDQENSRTSSDVTRASSCKALFFEAMRSIRPSALKEMYERIITLYSLTIKLRIFDLP